MINMMGREHHEIDGRKRYDEEDTTRKIRGGRYEEEGTRRKIRRGRYDEKDTTRDT